MTKTIDCFYTLSSPWAYFGGPRFVEVARRHGASFVLRPFDFLKVVPETGGIPLRTRPQPRQDYHALELDRWRRYLDMALNLKPKHYPPADNKAAARMVIATQRSGLDAQRLSHAILKALWAEEQDIALPTTRARIGNDCGMDGAALVAEENSAAVVGEYERNSADAVRLGIFGSPIYLYKGTPYWGQDRLMFLDRDLAAR